MRFLLPGLGLNLALCGLTSLSLPAIAVPTADAIDYLSIGLQQRDTVTIRGNGVEFVAPGGLEGGEPSGAQVRSIVQSAGELMPSYASLVESIFSNPSAFRAFAIDTRKSAENNVQMMMVQKLPVSVNTSLAEMEPTITKALNSMLPPGFKLLNSKIVTIGSRQIIRLKISVEMQGVKFNEWAGIIKEGDEFYQLIYGFANDEAGQVQENFDRMIRTFKSTSIAAVK